MTVLVSAIAFIVLLTFLILIHEVGHFMFARLFGVDVEEFGFGLPPKIKKLFHWSGTDFTLNWIPFGGFVRLKGESAISLEARHAKGSFARAPLWCRFIILLGGVLMNFLLAFCLLTYGFSVGRWVPNFYTSVEELQGAVARGEVSMTLGVSIVDVSPGGTAAKAGVSKDVIVESVDGTPVHAPQDLVNLQQGKDSVTYVIYDARTKVRRTVLVPLVQGKSGVTISPVAADISAPVRPVTTAMVLALKETKFMTIQTVKGILDLVRSLALRGRVPQGITGIVGIAGLTYQSVQVGFSTYLRLVALLSLSLAILNILPLPALDGGRLMFVLVEAMIRRPLNQRFELITNSVGFFILIGLIVIITFNDVIHLF